MTWSLGIVGIREKSVWHEMWIVYGDRQWATDEQTR
jgi:hypothetical protein